MFVTLTEGFFFYLQDIIVYPFGSKSVHSLLMVVVYDLLKIIILLVKIDTVLCLQDVNVETVESQFIIF